MIQTRRAGDSPPEPGSPGGWREAALLRGHGSPDGNKRAVKRLETGG